MIRGSRPPQKRPQAPAHSPFDFLTLDAASAERLAEVEQGWRSFVYVIQAGEDGPVKIGCSNSPIVRLNTMQTGAPWQLTLAAVVACRGMHALEKAAHREAAAHSVRGEWFDLSVLEAVELIQQAAAKTRLEILPIGGDFRPWHACYGERAAHEAKHAA